MSDEQKIYVPRSGAKQITFERSGKTILKLNFKVEDFIAFLNQHKNEKGYITLGVSERREVGKFGDTHCVWLDTRKPNQNGERPASRPASKPAQQQPPADESDQVPF